MNIKPLNVASVALFTWLFVSFPAPAQTVPISLAVEVAKTSKEKEKHSTPQPTGAPGSEDRLLEITLENPSSQALTNLEVKYWLLVRDVKSRDVTIGVNDSSTVILPPSGQLVVTSAVAKCDFTPRSGAGKTGAAKGNKFYGYGVQVLVGGKLAAQTYVPDDAKAEINGTANKEK